MTWLLIVKMTTRATSLWGVLQRSCSVDRWGRKVSHLCLASADLWSSHSPAGPCSKFKGRSCLETHCTSMEMTKPEALVTFLREGQANIGSLEEMASPRKA